MGRGGQQRRSAGVGAQRARRRPRPAIQLRDDGAKTEDQQRKAR
jgi:hypothetical protein